MKLSTPYLVALIGGISFVLGFLFDILYLSHLQQQEQQQNNAAASTNLRVAESSSTASISKIIVENPCPSSEKQITLYSPPNTQEDSFTSKTPVPNVVTVWRQGKLDWHDMIPQHNSKWDRFGTPKSEGKLPLLVNKEIQVTDFLTQFHESGLSAKYGHDHGTLMNYAGCDIFRSSCMVHKQDICLTNEFCEWNGEGNICQDKVASSDAQTCEAPKTITSNRIEKVNDPASCKNWIHDLTVVIYIDSESQSMYFHFWSSWNSIVSYWKGELQSNRRVHFVLSSMTDPMFFQYFGLISDYCWRRQENQIPPNTCFCNVKQFTSMQSLTDEKAASSAVLSYLGLENYYPPKDKVRIGLISRRRKRFILNEYELVDSVRSLGYEIDLLPLETMTMYEQMRALRSIDVLVGIHGSALDNSVFLHEGCVLVQLLPYSVEHRVTFESSATKAGVIYHEWQLKDTSKAVFHWDLMMQANGDKLKQFSKEDILKQGQSKADSRETLMFWINQDIIVPLDEWENIIQKAVKASPAASRGLVKP